MFVRPSPVTTTPVLYETRRVGKILTAAFTSSIHSQLYSRQSNARYLATFTLVSLFPNDCLPPSIHLNYGLPLVLRSLTFDFITLFTSHLRTPESILCIRKMSSLILFLNVSPAWLLKHFILRKINLLSSALTSTSQPQPRRAELGHIHLLKPSLCFLTQRPIAQYILRFTQHDTPFLHTIFHFKLY